MGRLFIAAIAAVGTVYKIDPVMRPFIDAGILILSAGFMFYLGDIVAGWLDRWENKPHWRKIRTPRQQHTHRPRQGGIAIPLLSR